MAYDPNELRDPEGTTTGGRWTQSPGMGSAAKLAENTPFISERLFKGATPAARAKFDQVSRVLSKLIAKTNRESGLIITARGILSEVAHGDEDAVQLPFSMIEFAKRNAESVFHHSHPGSEIGAGTSLSFGDLHAITEVAFNSVVAHSPDRSIFQASFMPSWRGRGAFSGPEGESFSDQYSHSLAFVDRALGRHPDYVYEDDQSSRGRSGARLIRRLARDIAESHLVNVHLRDKGIIDYRFKLSARTRGIIEHQITRNARYGPGVYDFTGYEDN